VTYDDRGLPIVPHAFAGGWIAAVVSEFQVRGEQAEIVCNERGVKVGTVGVADVGRVLMGMLSSAICSERLYSTAERSTRFPISRPSKPSFV